MNLLDKVITRQKLVTQIRQFFLDRHFQEITIPILHPFIPVEPNIYPFTTTWSLSQSKKQKLFLATSPESYLKQLISQGLGDCFAISSCFRNLENIGPHHQPEFLMLEWYEIDKNYLDIIATAQELLKSFGFSNFQKLSLKKFFSTFPATEPDFNQFFLNHVEPRLPTDPVFLTDYPAFLSPLAAESGEANKFFVPPLREARKILSASQSIAQRFELYINRVEIANGCTENLNPKISVPWGKIPPSAGCGLGLNRLWMVLNHQDNI